MKIYPDSRYKVKLWFFFTIINSVAHLFFKLEFHPNLFSFHVNNFINIQTWSKENKTWLFLFEKAFVIILN